MHSENRIPDLVLPFHNETQNYFDGSIVHPGEECPNRSPLRLFLSTTHNQADLVFLKISSMISFERNHKLVVENFNILGTLSFLQTLEVF